MGRAGVVRGWRGLGVNSFDLVGWSGATLRAQFSNLLIVNDALYVVDAGDGVTRRIAKAGFNVRDVGTIFITHHHDDHTAGLGTLMSAAWDNQRIKPINVYGPPRTEDLVKAAVHFHHQRRDQNCRRRPDNTD